MRILVSTWIARRKQDGTMNDVRMPPRHRNDPGGSGDVIVVWLTDGFRFRGRKSIESVASRLLLEHRTIGYS